MLLLEEAVATEPPRRLDMNGDPIIESSDTDTISNKRRNSQLAGDQSSGELCNSKRNKLSHVAEKPHAHNEKPRRKPVRNNVRASTPQGSGKAQKVVRWSDADGISNEGSHSQSGGNSNVDQNLNQAKFDHHKRCLVSPTGFLVTACASPGAMISFEPDGCLLSTQVDFDLPDYKPLDASALRNDKAARGKLKPTQRNSPFSPGPRADFHPFVEEQLSILEKISSQQPRHLEETLAMPVMQAMKILEERSVVVEDVKNQARSILERQDARGPQKFKSLAESVYLEKLITSGVLGRPAPSPLVDVHPHQLPPLKIQTASEMVECALTVENETVSQVKPDSALISFDSPAKVENVAQTEPDSLQEEIGVLDTSSANVQSRRDFSRGGDPFADIYQHIRALDWPIARPTSDCNRIVPLSLSSIENLPSSPSPPSSLESDSAAISGIEYLHPLVSTSGRVDNVAMMDIENSLPPSERNYSVDMMAFDDSTPPLPPSMSTIGGDSMMLDGERSMDTLGTSESDPAVDDIAGSVAFLPTSAIPMTSKIAHSHEPSSPHWRDCDRYNQLNTRLGSAPPETTKVASLKDKIDDKTSSVHSFLITD
ncbi:hypothetical protein PSTT_16243 [Puccinia striiformis]|uniref:Uncharacterized protein n=1 Tax=Puccinia striiformis TaxID=27350 RepID=A0A2S4UDP9_9BASI|nr:hypothetical protein PSTT_16243 [Puccinia striiformis]